MRRVLYAAGRALKLCELHHTTEHDRAEIGSVLVKLQRRGLVVTADGWRPELGGQLPVGGPDGTWGAAVGCVI